MSSAAALVPTYDFNKLEISLKNEPDSTLGSLLSQLATIPSPPSEKPVVKAIDPATAENLNEQMARSVEALPAVFGKVPLPANRRALRNTELAGLIAEKEEIDTAKKALTKRSELITRAVSNHFDVVAEKTGAAKPDETPVDANGHYLIGGSSKELRQEARVPGKDTFFVREKAKDKVDPSNEKLLDLYETGQITRAEYLSLTSEVTYRVLDEAKLRKGLLSKARRERTQEILRLISVVSYGTLSVKVRR